MAIKRSRADKIQDGNRAYEYRIAQYGPDEQCRAGQQAGWTKLHPALDKADNPYLRTRVYSSADAARAQSFASWRKANPARSHEDNPHSWSNAQRHSKA